MECIQSGLNGPSTLYIGTVLKPWASGGYSNMQIVPGRGTIGPFVGLARDLRDDIGTILHELFHMYEQGKGTDDGKERSFYDSYTLEQLAKAAFEVVLMGVLDELKNEYGDECCSPSNQE
jgi:hypothetical protein